MLLNIFTTVPVRQTVRAIYAGLFLNEILPMRIGELLRIYLISRWNSIPISIIVPSILVERFFDAIWLASAFGLTVLVVQLPRYLVNAEEILGYGLLVTTALVLLLLLCYKPKAKNPDVQLGSIQSAGRFRQSFEKLLFGVRSAGMSPLFYASGGTSLMLLVGQALSYWFLIRAYGLHLSFWQGAAVFLIVHIGTAIPSAPSNVGTYQFFTVLGLTLFGIEKTTATGFSIIAFLILTIPLWLLGLLAFLQLGISMKTIRRDIARLGFR